MTHLSARAPSPVEAPARGERLPPDSGLDWPIHHVLLSLRLTVSMKPFGLLREFAYPLAVILGVPFLLVLYHLFRRAPQCRPGALPVASAKTLWFRFPAKLKADSQSRKVRP